jgi:flavin-dependent dehydrogenase
MERFDVGIVGAGLAGLELCKELSKRGISVLLIDRKPKLETPIHTTGIFVRKTLEDFALPEHCLGTPVRHVRLHSPAGQSLALHSSFDEFRVGKMDKLYAHLLQEAQNAGAVFAGNTHFVGSHKSSHGSVLHLESGSAAHLESGSSRQTVEVRFLVGADGAMSKVARDLKLETNREFIIGVEDVLGGIPLVGEPCFDVYIHPKLAPGYIAWVVHDGQHVHLGTGGYAHQFNAANALGAFKKLVSSQFDFSNAVLLERRGGKIPVGGVLKNIVNRRGLLLGDAAGAVSPLTAGGLDPAMRLAHFSAALLERHLGGDSRALSAYNGSVWRSRFASRLWLRRVLTHVTQPQLLELGFTALKHKPFKSLAWHVFFGRGGSFPALNRQTRVLT